MRVKKIDISSDSNMWNQFVKESKNSTFLFDRNFMDYHADRFLDYSLMIFDNEGQLLSAVPANINSENQVISHQGLSYGGFLLQKESKLVSTLIVVYHTLKFLHDQGIKVFLLKSFPWFYNVNPTDEIEYALFLLDAELYRRDIAYVIDLQNRIPYTGNIRREGNKAEKLTAIIKEDDSLDEFWNEVLSPNLMERFGVKPVHLLEEIKLLQSYFPKNIKQFNVYLEEKVVAGTTLFITDKVVHCQYISSNEYGRKTGCLNYLFKHLMDNTFTDKRYFDFGIVNENGGRGINSGMLFWKESFGGRAQKHDFYRINTANYKVLEPYI